MFGENDDHVESSKGVVDKLQQLGVVSSNDVASRCSATAVTVQLKDEITLTKAREIVSSMRNTPFVGVSVTEGRLDLHCSRLAPRASKRKAIGDNGESESKFATLVERCKRMDVDPGPVVKVASAMDTLRGTNNEEAVRAISVSNKRFLAISVRGGVVVSLRSLLGAVEASGSADGVLGVRPSDETSSPESMLSTASFLPADATLESLGIRDLLAIVLLKDCDRAKSETET